METKDTFFKSNKYHIIGFTLVLLFGVCSIILTSVFFDSDCDSLDYGWDKQCMKIDAFYKEIAIIKLSITIVVFLLIIILHKKYFSTDMEIKNE
jgi:hypothetical protein